MDFTKKLEELKLLLHEAKFDILAITKTDLSESDHSNSQLCIEQYSLPCKKRQNWTIKLLERSSLLHWTRRHWFEYWNWINMVECLYSHPRNYFLDVFIVLRNIKVVLNDICHRSNILLIEDFDINLSNNCDKTS